MECSRIPKWDWLAVMSMMMAIATMTISAICLYLGEKSDHEFNKRLFSTMQTSAHSISSRDVLRREEYLFPLVPISINLLNHHLKAFFPFFS